MKLALNFILFQLGWFSCVLGAANGLFWLGPLVVLAVVMIHLVLALRPAAELYLALGAVALGLLTDSLLLATGWLTYAGPGLFGVLAPYWIVSMWALFATTLNVSLRWLRNRPALTVLMGLIGGPLSYLGGEKLGAMVFVAPVPALVALGLAWAAAMPVLVWLARRFDGVNPHRNRQAELAALPWQVSADA